MCGRTCGLLNLQADDMIFYFTLFLETPNLHSYVVYGALVMVGGGKCMIQQCLDLYPSVEAHHKQWEELLAEGWNRLFGCEDGPEGCP